MATNSRPTFWTVATIASHLGVPRHRVEYVIETRRISPIGTAGIARVFDARDVDRVADELSKIESERLAHRLEARATAHHREAIERAMTPNPGADARCPGCEGGPSRD